jgi:hypothetical protein
MDDPEYRPGDWLLGRATYFDAPDAWKRTFAPHVFGDLHGNGCGFVNKHEGVETNDDFPFPKDAVAAVADFDARLFEGACGSCFEIKCVTGPVLWSYDQNDRVVYTDPPGFYERAPNAPDTFGRVVPRRNAESFDGVDAEYARCWNESRSLFVTVVDKCPCEYFYEQTVCCGPMPHFDLSYYAHETLAHPIQGKMMIKFRPVSCRSQTPVDARLGAAARMDTRAVSSEDGVLSRADAAGQRVARFSGKNDESQRRRVAVFAGGPAPGWLLSAYGDRFVTVFARGRGVDGGNATCFTIRPGGRLLARCERCEETLKPFAGNDGRVVTFWINVTKPVGTRGEEKTHSRRGSRASTSPCLSPRRCTSASRRPARSTSRAAQLPRNSRAGRRRGSSIARGGSSCPWPRCRVAAPPPKTQTPCTSSSAAAPTASTRYAWTTCASSPSGEPPMRRLVFGEVFHALTPTYDCVCADNNHVVCSTFVCVAT